jgi:hypothetical protein
MERLERASGLGDCTPSHLRRHRRLRHVRLGMCRRDHKNQCQQASTFEDMSTGHEKPKYQCTQYQILLVACQA